MNAKRQEAQRIARHLFSTMAQAAGMAWNTDNDSDVDYLVDLMIDAATSEILHGPDLPRLIVRGCEQVAGKRVE